MRDWLTTFLADPAVMALGAVALLSLGTFVLTIYRAVSGGTFDATKVPKILDTLVLRRLVPLGVLGITAYAAPVGITHDALLAAYFAGAAATAASELVQLLTLVRDTGIPEVPMTEPPNG
ncbi:MAG: hypothetical protein KKF88_02410 [Alphaproteobacteria bacterium]|nr:hypothetical protein [Alphaproteobacteria bacterium]